ncbi:hypothetical protein C8J57DRAFT_1635386 [Mycena rebaudengoi]|nr:hypothetical protein C8J57DRAFT_1635386 [Mycena rebaudengoi]
MGKRKNHTHYDIPASEDEEDEAPTTVPRLGRMLQETASRGLGGESRYKSTMVNVPLSPVKHTRRAAEAEMLREDLPYPEFDQPIYDLKDTSSDSGEDDSEDEGGAQIARFRDSGQDDPLKQWVRDYRDEFLDELLRWEGRGSHRGFELCEDCRSTKLAADNARAAATEAVDLRPSADPHDSPDPARNPGDVPLPPTLAKGDHRCIDCIGGGQLLCAPCLILRHKQLPLHRVQQYWNGDFFAWRTLRDLGLRVQLGHWEGYEHRCPVPESVCGDVFIIMDNHGIHEVNVDFCGCGGGGSHNIQLLHAGLYPATTTNPRTVATFALLRRFHLLSFESKCSSYEFYHSLAREKDNGGIKPPRNRYHEWRRMTREWRNLQMLKRAGRGHAQTGANGTEPGECALLCPACPQPGKNLPDGWETAADEDKFLYARFLAIDANFRLKWKDVGKYMQHVEKHWNMKQERSRCVAHNAVDKPDKESRGTVSSGVGAVDCARHNMKRPQSVGDLQLGEQYINMDYMFFVGIQGSELQRFYVSYDIACQWHINLWLRMMKYDHDIRFVREGKYMTFLVPKFHFPTHIEACNLLFSFNLTRDVGDTDGEAPERGWANTNPLASSTTQMGPGARRDLLDDHFNDWNHKKIVGFGRLMRRKIEAVVPEMVETRLTLAEMEAGLAKEEVYEWSQMAMAWEETKKAWEENPKPPNPFKSSAKDTHLAKVRLDLAREAAAREQAGTEDEDEVRGDMHVTECITMGVQLEEQQRVLGADVAAMGQHPSDDQRRVMVERTSKLRRKILSWMDIQMQHFPFVTRVRELEDRARVRMSKTQVIPGILVHEMALWLLSTLMNRAGATQAESGCKTTVVEYEYRLRVGQAHEALDELRRLLLGSIEGMTDQIHHAAEQYRGARRAIVTLGRVLEVFEWQVALKPLLEDDVRGIPKAHFGDPERQAGRKKGKGKRSSKRRKVKHQGLSWIWLTPGARGDEGEAGTQGGQAAMDEGKLPLRIEWAKARARSMRSSEEVCFLEEEMRRILAFLQWWSGWWTEQVGLRTTKVNGGELDEAQQEGDKVYALRQAALKSGHCAVFGKRWKDVPTLIRDARAAMAKPVEMDPVVPGMSEEDSGDSEEGNKLGEDSEETEDGDNET